MNILKRSVPLYHIFSAHSRCFTERIALRFDAIDLAFHTMKPGNSGVVYSKELITF